MSDPREEALYAAVKAGTEELMTRVLAVYAAEDGWRNQLRAVAYELLRFLEEDRDRARQMMIEAPMASERIRAIRENGIEGLTALIDLGRNELPDPSSVPPGVAEVTAGAIYNRMHVAVEADEFGPAAHTMVPELMYSAVLPYLGPEAAAEELQIPSPTH